MIDELDEALRRMMMRELPIKNGEVDIDFHQPKREWSARLSRPSLNFFLYDVRENVRLRGAQPPWQIEPGPNNTVIQRRRPVRLDASYIITAWATEPEDEHRLLGRTLMVLFAHPELPQDLLPEGLTDQPVPIQYMAAQKEDLQNTSDLWSALDNELRPAIVCVLTMAINPYRPFSTPLVRSALRRFGQAEQPWRQRLDEEAGREEFWTVGGHVINAQAEPLDGLCLRVIERGLDVRVEADGRFAIGPLRGGEYTLELTGPGRTSRQYPISVPAPDYELEV